MKPTVSVIIPTMTGGFTHLAGLLPLLSLEPDKEIIIVDNASRDGTTNYLSNHECVVIVNKSNEGFAKANNKAALYARGEYLLFLNNDTRINPGFLQEMVNTFSADPKVGVVGCLILELEEKKVQHAGIMFTDEYVPYELGSVVPGITSGIPFNDDRVHAVREVPSVTGACLMVKKSLYQELGGFDEEYKNGWEDNDFVLKVREKGYKVYYTGKTYIRHRRFGSHGRLAWELQNRQRYDAIWVATGRAKKALGEFING